MRKTIYHLIIAVLISVFIISCGGGGGGSTSTNNDCMLGTSKLGDCTIK